MMLPIDRLSIEPTPPGSPSPAGKIATAADTDGNPTPPHSDYNHQPLLVSGLEHYLKPEQDERFHVS
ncbi:hypothetical protein [Rhodanobacter sp. DHB23]|uniref:hypothetical protein n=1 Tax=Rhodanobacter sp. DHB23 TaxID=2775923 RepID=UPI00177C85F4|nr:hypothetical protein [Rhodanobacter sp. DHB23]MBD8871745.1 hypothetical protein [Rhodanobacter sp. DHB23]